MRRSFYIEFLGRMPVSQQYTVRGGMKVRAFTVLGAIVKARRRADRWCGLVPEQQVRITRLD